MSSEGYDPSASGSSAEVDPMIGQIIDKRYQLTKKLGEGGMGEVYAADHLRISRSVAIKLLRAEVLTNEEAVKRFEQEAMTASSIGHENIIRIEDSGKLEDGRIYLAMELLDGLPFNDLIEQPTPISNDRLLNILIQTCHGLAAAHNKNIVHRDMKPENIYITQSTDGADLPKLLDFGIAKVSQAEGENHLTRTGTIFGTPFYMAPEQALGQAVDHRVDVYAMGVIMYEVFCGAVPFGGESFMGILTQHITAEPVLPNITASENGRLLPGGIEDVIIRSMKKDPNDRYQDMDELVQALIPIYRGLAGAGMSTYMAAHTPAPGSLPNPYATGGAPQHVPSDGSRPYQAPTGAPISAPTGAPIGAPTGAPSGAPMRAPMSTTGVPSHGTTPPHSAPYAQSGGYSEASDSLMMPARKSRTGLFIAIFLVLAMAGGGAGYLLSQNGDDDAVSAKEQKAGKDKPVADPDVKPGLDDPDPGKGDPDPDPGKGDPDPANTLTDPDAGTAAPENPDKNDPSLVDPPVEMVTVLLNSRPPRAKVYRDGKKIGVTPMNLKVDKNSPTSVVLKLKKHLDEQVIVDGTEPKVTTRLNRKNKPSHKPDPGKPDPGKPDPGKPDPGKPDPKPDPCKKNPNLPECMLE